MDNKNKKICLTKQISFVFLIIIAILVFNSGILGLEAKTKKPIQNNDEILVKFKGVQEVQKIKVEEKELISIKNAFATDPNVQYVEPNFIYRAAIIPSDTNFSNQWYLNRIKAPEAWNIERESSHIIVAVIDSGVQIDHPDLKDNIWVNNREIPFNKIDDDKNGYIDDANGWDFINNTASPTPKFKEGFNEAGVLHGTIVSGVIAASGNNAAGVTGVTWKTQIMPLKVLDDSGEGNTDKVIAAIDYAINNGADIINLSFVGLGYSQSLDEAIKRAHQAGIIIVAAAGNEQSEGMGYDIDKTPMYPACNDGPNGENRVIGVAATDNLDQKASFSSYGHKCVDISAPGIGIYSTVVYDSSKRLDNKFFDKYYDGYWSGTSMAAPMVAGAAALLLELNPRLAKNENVSILLNTADNIEKLNPKYEGTLGKGRLNVYAAVKYAKENLNNNIIKLAFTPYSLVKSSSTVAIADINGKKEVVFEPFKNYKNGLSVASGDVDGDNLPEFVVAQKPGGSSMVRIFDAKFKLKKEFYAYDKRFKGGVNIAIADLNQDGKKEIITAPASNGGPHIRVFDSEARLLSQFFAYASTYTGGVNLAAGDVDNDSRGEIITGTGKNGGPQVRVFKINGKIQTQFFAYDQKFRGGVRVTVADLSKGNRGNKVKIVTAPGIGGGPQIKIFNSKGQIESQFMGYNSNFRGGVELAAGDLDNDSFDEIITGAGPGGAPHVKIFNNHGILLGSFYAFENSYSGGVDVAIFGK